MSPKDEISQFVKMKKYYKDLKLRFKLCKILNPNPLLPPKI